MRDSGTVLQWDLGRPVLDKHSTGGVGDKVSLILARHCGLRVAAVSAITNLAEGMSSEQLSHEHTLANADKAATDLSRLITSFCEALAA